MHTVYRALASLLLASTLHSGDTTMKIVQATLQHNPHEIAHTINRAYARVPYVKDHRITPDEVTRLISHQHKTLYLCVNDKSHICGTALLDSTEPHQPEMGLFATDPAHKGHNVGTRLLDHVQEQVRLAGIADHLYIHVIPLFQARLVAYYERQGFTATGEIGYLTQETLKAAVKPEYWATIYYQVMRKRIR